MIDRKIQSLDAREEEKIIRMLKGWMLERGYALSSKKYRPAYDKIGIESPSIVRHMKKILKFLEEEDGRDEQEKISGLLKTSIFLFIEIQSRIRKRLTLLKLYSQIFGKK